ncbi:transcription elongation factor B polypeptide 3 [Phymastichus coffea]|uniref:transcription elongation factor B polypeptide 3 n=1 Tax=Phymastichus coffea TaxID=108790 RepID=UPI00273C89C0|nr:transcription elongation factor B polypeptide 3 [Phymastichus coffea]
MESTEERILHYQRGIDRSVLVLDKPRLLHCIKALSKLPVTMRHLKSTGIGRTVNALRKIEDGVGDASKRLVTKWKDMVSNTPDSGDSDEACVPDDPDNYESVNDQENSLPTNNNPVDDNYLDSYNGISRPEALDRPVLSPPMVIDVNVSPEEPAPNLSDEDNESEETNYNQSSKNLSSKDKESKKDSKSSNSSRHSSSKDKKELSKISKNSKDTGNEEQHKKKDKDKTKNKSESSCSKDKKNLDVKKRKVDSSDNESNPKKQKLSVCEDESDNDEELNNFVIDNDEDQESSSNERDSEVRESSKDRHKESSLKHSDKSSNSSKSKDKRSSSSSSSSKAKLSSYHELKKDKEERSKKDDKQKLKSSHGSSSSNKAHNGKDKNKHDKGDDRGKSKNDEKDKIKDKKDQKKSKEQKEQTEKKKSKRTTIDGSIDSMSGTSFADALGMCSMPPPKKKKDGSLSKSSSKVESSNTLSPQPSPTKPNPSKSKTEYKPSSSPTPDSSPTPEDSLALLAPNVKLEPLSNDLNEEVDLASTLPEPSPFYKPLPQVNHVQRRVDEETMLSQIINTKVQRTKVYSGNKSGWTSVPSLQEICIRVLIENIDALEYTGGVPFDILKPVLERASVDQLFMLEYHNPYLVEESDQLWKFHCNKYFKNKLREEMESWREMYMRCLTEREAKFKAITANIKQSIDKSTPVRSTKLAYVDHFVKPPRNVLRQQAKYGTAKVTTSASDLKKKLITGIAVPSSSSSSSSNSSSSSSGNSSNSSSNSGNSSSQVERISVPPPPASRSRAPSAHPIKKAKAPLMAKALQAIKGRYKR